jgi:fucose 4-O-acetylase-like acetyltransferase
MIDNIIYSFHMPLFFFLSGFMFYGSFVRRGGGKLILNKIDTVFYPFVIWSLLQGIIESFLSTYTNGNVTYSDVLSLLWAPRAQFWFLYALFFIFVVSSTVFALVTTRAAVVLLIFSIVVYLSYKVLPEVAIFTLVAQNLVYFAFGVCFSLGVAHKSFARPLWVISTACFFFAGQYLMNIVFPHSYMDHGVASLVLALISIAFLVTFSSAMAQMKVPFLAFLGVSSMGIYLMHILAGSGIRILLKNVLGVQSFAIHAILGVVVAVALPLLAMVIIKKLRIPYVFSAPISAWLGGMYCVIRGRLGGRLV